MTRTRSFWAWGYEDKLPDEGTREAMAAQASGLLGIEGLSARPIPRFEDARIPAPRIAIPSELEAHASGHATAAPRERARCTYGKSYGDIVRAFHGDFSSAPDFVYFPHDEAGIARALAWCSSANVAVIPFGGGTSVVSGVEGRDLGAYAGVVTMDLARMDRVLEVDEVSRAARIQAGATGPSLEKQLGERGYTLRHFPQSFEFSTLGGWIATRAGGHFATLYTHIDDLVESVRMVTPRGVFASPRLPASGAGPSPDRLVLGSEGILGVISEAWVRVLPRPRFRATASVFFATFEEGARAARGIAQAGLYPSNCRLLDAREAMLNGVPTDGGAVLLLAFESADAPRGAWIDRAIAIAIEHGGKCPSGPKLREGERGGDASAEAWRQAFVDMPYLQSALVSLGAIADTFETACTWDRWEALYEGVTRAMRSALTEVCGGGSLTCRFTHVYPDGPAPYFTFVGRATPGEELTQWLALKRAAGDALRAHGGTITHHHAVGRLHRPWYDTERPDLFADALRASKRAMDPRGVLNPGVLIEPLVDPLDNSLVNPER